MKFSYSCVCFIFMFCDDNIRLSYFSYYAVLSMNTKHYLNCASLASRLVPNEEV